ncbi:MAG: ABC transporter ATP-binding protein [Bdellovibrionales bacterium]|jgi:lipoprotein-releasing system ATP-binding protein
MSSPALHLQDIRRSFTQGEGKLDVLRGCQLTIERGEKVALIGPSGSGKSTLLQIAGLLEKPDEGAILIDGQKADSLGDEGRTALRRQAIGFVYQYHHLLPEFTARENIMLPQMIAGVKRQDAGKRADELLSLIDLSARASHRPSQLSGGEQQRIAIARALANRPALLIADEPTGNLDPHTADHVFAILQDLVSHQGLGLLMATHNHALAARMDHACELKDGLLAVIQ